MIHPYQPAETVQGALELLYELQGYLAEISGFDAVTLQPAAGAHGELTGSWSCAPTTRAAATARAPR
jgi:glycine dehydrogenase subunit 2